MPALEALEPRWTPACLVTPNGGTLTIEGDDTRQVVWVMEDPVNNRTIVQVNCNAAVDGDFTDAGDTMITYSREFSRMEIQLAAGNDQLILCTASDWLDADRFYEIRLGGGHDWFAFATTDIMGLGARNIQSSNITMTVNGANGNDTVRMTFLGDINDSLVNIEVKLRAGNDSFTGTFDRRFFDVAADGFLHLDVFGDEEDDRLSIVDSHDGDVTVDGTLDVVLDGGSEMGRDSCLVVPTMAGCVDVRNCNP